MDIYEMMKNGMSQEEIFQLFKQECADANTKIAKEQQKANEKEAMFNEARAHALNSIVAYLVALGEPAPTEEEIVEMEAKIKEFEVMLTDMVGLLKALNAIDSTPKQKKKRESGDRLIRDLVKEMIK